MVIIIGAGLDYVAVSAELEFSRGSVRAFKMKIVNCL